jgi:hypothetical protein
MFQTHGFIGIVHCTVLPPQGEFLPFLPQRVKIGDQQEERLVFANCQDCSQNARAPPCYCSDEKREFETHLTGIELARALEIGYKVTIHSGWRYDHSVCYRVFLLSTTFLVLES